MKAIESSNKKLYGVSYFYEDRKTGRTASRSNALETEELREDFIATIKEDVCDIFTFELTIIKAYGKDNVIRIQYNIDENWRRIFYVDNGIIYKYDEKQEVWKQYNNTEEITELIGKLNELI